LLTAARTNWNFELARSAKKIKYKVYIQFETVFRQRLLASIIFFITKAFIGGYYYFWTFNISVMITSRQSNLTRDRIAATGASFDRFRQVAPTCTCSSNARCFEPKGAPRPFSGLPGIGSVVSVELMSTDRISNK